MVITFEGGSHEFCFRLAGAAPKKEGRPFADDRTSSMASASPADDTSRPTQAPLPKEYLCPVCKDVLRDAVIVACCGQSFCDECIRQKLIGVL